MKFEIWMKFKIWIHFVLVGSLGQGITRWNLPESFCRTDQLLHSFENSVVTVWNSLPSPITCSPSLASFKKKIETYDLSKFVSGYITRVMDLFEIDHIYLKWMCRIAASRQRQCVLCNAQGRYWRAVSYSTAFWIETQTHNIKTSITESCPTYILIFTSSKLAHTDIAFRTFV